MDMILSEISPYTRGADFGKNRFNKMKADSRFRIARVHDYPNLGDRTRPRRLRGGACESTGNLKCVGDLLVG